MKYHKIAIIGAGNVGSSIAYSCMLQGITAEIILIDINENFCKGQVLDLSDALAFSASSHIKQGTFKDASQADIIVICAGAKQKPGQPRTELINTNKKVIASIFEQMQPLHKDALVIIVTNPLDVLTLYAQTIAQHPRNLVFGSGTFLDTQRLRGYVGQQINVAPESVNAYVLGEHGDSEFVAWSAARIAGNPIAHFKELTPAVLDKIQDETRKKAYEIIDLKGSTYFGIGTCVATICKIIIFDEKEVLPLSFYHEKYEICFSLPVVLGAQGVGQQFDVPLNNKEQELLEKSISQIKSTL